MSDPKPTILFVHGAWHTPACFGPVRSLLEKAGYATSSPHLPTAKDILPPVDMNADAQCLRDELRKLVEEEERDVIIIAHSYGGVVTTQAVEQIFSQKGRKKDGKKGGVERLVYITAILLGLDERVSGLLGGALSDVLSIDDDGFMAIKDPGNHFYSDLPAVDQKKWVDQLVKHPALASQTQVTHLAYPYYPITYVYCEDDQMIPFEVQKLLVEKRKAEGVEVTEKWWPGGHSPFLTMPERILELLESEK